MPKDNKDTIEYVSEEDEGGIDKKVKKTKSKLKQCQKEKEEYLAGWQRAKADLINSKKEAESRMADYYKFANQGLLLEVLTVLDSFELALKHEQSDGTLQLYNQLKNILKNNGLEEIKTIGEKFEPEFHESVGETKGGKSGLIAEEVQKGYTLNNKVIRASKVKINK